MRSGPIEPSDMWHFGPCWSSGIALLISLWFDLSIRIYQEFFQKLIFGYSWKMATISSKNTLISQEVLQGIRPAIKFFRDCFKISPTIHSEIFGRVSFGIFLGVSLEIASGTFGQESLPTFLKYILRWISSEKSTEFLFRCSSGGF